MLISANITEKKGGKPSKAQMARAKKLTQSAINGIGRKAVAEQFGITVQTTYQWELIPADRLPVFCAKLAPGAKMEDLRPDMFTAKG